MEPRLYVGFSIILERPQSKSAVEAAVIFNAAPASRACPPSLTHAWTHLWS